MLEKIFESIMLICFGCAWPFAIAKSLKSKSADGKSPAFLIILIIGYVAGLLSHLFGEITAVVLLYLLNATMVTIDLMLVFKYRKPGDAS
jgi:hypothetical protein